MLDLEHIIYLNLLLF